MKARNREHDHRSMVNRPIPIDTDAPEGPRVEASNSHHHDYHKMKADGMTDQLLVKHLRKDLEDHGLPISAAFARDLLIKTGVIVQGSDTGKSECETQIPEDHTLQAKTNQIGTMQTGNTDCD